jgi:hypothetical protein
MIEVRQHPTVTATDVNLQVLQRSPDGVAFASFPKFWFAIHPEYLVNGDLNCIERANGGLCAPMQNNMPIPKTTFPNGAIGFDLKALRDGEGYGSSYGQVALKSTRVPMANEFSFAIAHLKDGVLTTEGLSIFHFVRDSTNLTEGYPRVILRGNVGRMALYNGATMLVEEPSVAVTAGIVQIYVITYSNEQGSKIYRNGDLIASNPVAVAVNPAACLDAYFQSGVSAFTNTTVFINSPAYVTTVDVSKPEHAAKRAAMTDYLTKTYKA